MHKPTAFQRLLTSLRIRLLKLQCRQVWLFPGMATIGVALAFFLGTQSRPVDPEFSAEMNRLKAEISTQRGALEAFTNEKQTEVAALAARLARLQASSTRIDALGQRLVRLGQLSTDEFDFDEPAPVGGPIEALAYSSVSLAALSSDVETLDQRLLSQSAQLNALQALLLNRQLEEDFTPAGWPVEKGWISSGYGMRNDPFTGQRARHWGLDFAGARGVDVLSVASGVVIWAGNRSGYGKTVDIDHGNGYITRYAHNDSLNVDVGQHVKAGETIAKMGSTGRASAPHVHFEVLKDGNKLNPAKFVRNLR